MQMILYLLVVVLLLTSAIGVVVPNPLCDDIINFAEPWGFPTPSDYYGSSLGHW